MNLYKPHAWWLGWSDDGRDRREYLRATTRPEAETKAAAAAAKRALAAWTLGHDPAAEYSVRFRYRGQAFYRTLGTPLKDEAERRARQLAKTVREGRFDVLEATKARRDLAHLAEVFQIYRQRCHATTRENNIGALCCIIRRALPAHAAKSKTEIGALPTSVLTATLMADFQAALLADAGEDRVRRNTAAITANSYRRQARSLFTEDMMLFYEDLTLPDLTPFLRVKPIEERGKRFVMPAADFLATIRDRAAELRTTDPNAYRIYLLSFGLGLRRRESAYARWDWITSQSVPVPGGGAVTRSFLHVQCNEEFDTKDRDDRLIPLEAYVLAELQALRLPRVGPGPDYLLDGHLTERFRDSFDRFSAWLKALGWDRKKKSHEFRKIFNTLYRQQAGAAAARQALGHDSDRVNTDHYTDERYTLPSVKIFGT